MSLRGLIVPKSRRQRPSLPRGRTSDKSAVPPSLSVRIKRFRPRTYSFERDLVGPRLSLVDNTGDLPICLRLSNEGLELSFNSGSSFHRPDPAQAKALLLGVQASLDAYFINKPRWLREIYSLLLAVPETGALSEAGSSLTRRAVAIAWPDLDSKRAAQVLDALDSGWSAEDLELPEKIPWEAVGLRRHLEILRLFICGIAELKFIVSSENLSILGGDEFTIAERRRLPAA